MEIPLIEFRDVTKSFGDKIILKGANLKIYENQITTIIGKSGTGKSVLLKLIVGLMLPDAGDILFWGTPVRNIKKSEWDKCRSEISYMFQNNALFDSMTVFENIALPLSQTTKINKKDIEQRVMAKIEQMELSDVPDKYPAELSGGMQKRTALARALVTEPKIVIFDEPTTGQDPIRKNMILSMIAQYRKKFGFTAILVSHDIPDVFFISDRIILLWEGKIAFEGSYEASMRLDHPMVQEVLQSLEGFQDELTGLLSKQMFRLRYTSAFGRLPRKTSVTAILFVVEFERLAEMLGHETAVEVLRALGVYISTHLGGLGGYSTRQGTDQILTVLPHVDLDEAHDLVENVGKVLQDRVLRKIQRAALTRTGHQTCFEIRVSAGIIEVRSNEEVETIMNRAKGVQKMIAVLRCD
jgi:phospholipid/cholesterol/gamma-HCH transport system ATP-binding protein